MSWVVLVAVLAVVFRVWCPAASSRGAGDQCGGRGTSLSATVAAKTVLPAVLPRWAAAVASKKPSPGPWRETRDLYNSNFGSVQESVWRGLLF